jgi:hypothetical protein
MSQVTDIILITRKNEHVVSGLWDHLHANHAVIYLQEVSSAVHKHSQCSVWMGGVDELDTQAFLEKFEKINWESPAQVQLLLKHAGDATFTEHRPSSIVQDALRKAYQALRQNGAPEVCDECAETCDQLYECECEMSPSCHAIRETFIEQQRQEAIELIRAQLCPTDVQEDEVD